MKRRRSYFKAKLENNIRTGTLVSYYNFVTSFLLTIAFYKWKIVEHPRKAVVICRHALNFLKYHAKLPSRDLCWLNTGIAAKTFICIKAYAHNAANGGELSARRERRNISVVPKQARQQYISYFVQLRIAGIHRWFYSGVPSRRGSSHTTNAAFSLNLPPRKDVMPGTTSHFPGPFNIWQRVYT